MVVLLPITALAQSHHTSSIRGYVFDEYKEPLVSATVMLLNCGDPIRTSLVDLDGLYQFNYLHPGEYEIVVRYLGWQDSVTGISLSNDKTLHLDDIILSITDGIVSCDFHLPETRRIDPWQPETQTIFRREQIIYLPRW